VPNHSGNHAGHYPDVPNFVASSEPELKSTEQQAFDETAIDHSLIIWGR